MPQGEWPKSFSAIHAFGFVFSQSENICRWQKKQLPHDIGNETTTRSPTFRFLTSGPTSTISPMNSWPSMSPFSIVGMKPLYRCRSEPQIAVELILTIASRRLRIFGSGTCSTRTSFLPYQQFALITSPFFGNHFHTFRLAARFGDFQADAFEVNRPASSFETGRAGRCVRMPLS